MDALQVAMLFMLFTFEHKHLKWSVYQPDKFNHIFFLYFSPPPLCSTMTVKHQQF